MLETLTPHEGQEFRAFFLSSGYSRAALEKQFSISEIPQLQVLRLYGSGIPLGSSPLDLLFQWFWINVPVDNSVAASTIPPYILDLFLKSGVLVREGTLLRSTVNIAQFADYLLLSDHAVGKTSTSASDLVLWPNPTTLLCHHLSIRTPGARTLDLGTGNGVLAMAAAGHSRQVIATDLNPRAREFCLFNAAINGIANLEFREGNSFQPVAGEQFDLILANPPFFVTPSLRHLYSDNGFELDGFCRMLIDEAPSHLTEGGYCQMLAEWVELEGEDWRDRLKAWFAQNGCDVWVLATYTRSATNYAIIRNYEELEDSTSDEVQAARILSWQAYFKGKGLKAIHGGIIVLRKRTGHNWIRMEESQVLPTRPFGEAVLRIFANRDAMERYVSDDDLLASRPALPASARLEHQSVISPEGWQTAALDVRLDEPLPRAISLQPPVAQFLALCDGKRTLRENTDRVAASLKVDPAAVRRECCTVIRHLADRNMVYFPEAG